MDIETDEEFGQFKGKPKTIHSLSSRGKKQQQYLPPLLTSVHLTYVST